MLNVRTLDILFIDGCYESVAVVTQEFDKQARSEPHREISTVCAVLLIS